MTIIDIARSAALLCKKPRPTALIGNGDVFETELLECIQQTGDEIATRYAWRALVKDQDFTTDSATTKFIMPVGYHRLTENNAVTCGASKVIRGGLSSSEWRMYVKSSSTTYRYMMMGKTIEVFPAVTAADSPMNVQFVTNRWVTSAGGESSVILTDADTVAFPERLLAKGAAWRWKRMNKHAYQSELAEYEDDLAIEIAADGGNRIPTGARVELVAKKEAAA